MVDLSATELYARSVNVLGVGTSESLHLFHISHPYEHKKKIQLRIPILESTR